MRALLLSILLVVIAGPVNAADPAAGRPPGPSAAPVVQSTRVETDQKTGVIRFIVNGREEALIDSTGLHVRHNVEYGGTITDTGVAFYNKASGGQHAR